MSAVADTAGAAKVASAAAVRAKGTSISFEAVTVAYRGTTVLESFSLEVTPGEILALIGPSGSGKTTALRAVAGFVRPKSGRIRIGGEDVTDVPPYARGLGMVVQNYALFPHMRVDENVAFGLRAQGAARGLIAERVHQCLTLVGMADYVRRYPRELSGGQQQRVAIARALAIRPRVLLLDEPLSALDAQIRRSMVDELARLHRELPELTVLYVTHDQSEALTLADRIAIMRDGRLSAFGPSHQLYRRPANRFAAEFLGRANLLPVRLEAVDPATGISRVRFGDAAFRAHSAPHITVGDACLLCIRPHEVTVGARSGANNLTGTVASVLWQGDQRTITIETGGVPLRLVSPPTGESPQLGTSLTVGFTADDAVLISLIEGMASVATPASPSLDLGPFWVLAPVAVIAALFLYPLGLIIGEALTGGSPDISLAHFGAVLATTAFQRALLHTIEISVAASGGCILLGLVLALILSFVPFPGSRTVARLVETTIALPTFLAALALTFLYGSAGILNETLMAVLHSKLPPVDFLYSPWGVILAEVTVYTPFVMRPLLAAFSLIDVAQIEVASSLGARPSRIVRRIILPAAIPALLAGGSLCLLLTVNEFGIVLFIGAKGVITLPLLVYDKAIQEFDYTTACVIAVVNIILSLSLYSLYRVVLNRFSGRHAGLG